VIQDSCTKKNARTYTEFGGTRAIRATHDTDVSNLDNACERDLQNQLFVVIALKILIRFLSEPCKSSIEGF
jgi:hypothetical protein